jgi:hypothetical protein
MRRDTVSSTNIKSLTGLFILLLFSLPLAAQRTEYVCGEYSYPASIDVTPRQAMQEARERAKIDAIGKMFGITVSEQTFLDRRDENGNLSTTFRSVGGTEVKGEWIKDSTAVEHPPYYNEVLKLWMYKVSVCGTAREVISAGVNFTAKVLNNADSKYETDTFNDGEDIFLSFRAPVDGYLAVYLMDDSQTAFCMLPYRKDPTKKVKITGGKDYIFFSRKHAERGEASMVAEYMMACEKATEQNILYVIFSPNEFTKANDAYAGGVFPSEMSAAEFQKWLAENRQKDKDMKVVSKFLTIKK